MEAAVQAAVDVPEEEASPEEAEASAEVQATEDQAVLTDHHQEAQQCQLIQEWHPTGSHLNSRSMVPRDL